MICFFLWQTENIRAVIKVMFIEVTSDAVAADSQSQSQQQPRKSGRVRRKKVCMYVCLYVCRYIDRYGM